MEEMLIQTLLNNIAYEQRHPHYDHTVKVAEFCRQIVLGKDQKKILDNYRRTEDDQLKKQRGRLTNTLTQFVVSRPRKYFQKISRVEGINELWKADDPDQLKALQQSFTDFQDGRSLIEYLNFKLEYLGCIDPNAWVIFQRLDDRDLEGNITNTRVYPFVVNCADALNWKRTFGKLDWLIVREGRMEVSAANNVKVEKCLEDFYLYAPGYAIRAREAGEATVIEPGETERKVTMASGTAKTFYVQSWQNGTVEVPGMCAGTYPDDETNQETFVPWFYAAKQVLLDLIRDKSFLDTTKALHVFAKRWEYTKGCQASHPDHGNCERGYYGGIRDEDHKCGACGGSGIVPAFTTEQQTLILKWPERADQLMDLSKLSHVESLPIDLPVYLGNEIATSERRFMETALNSGVIEKATGTADKTATLTNYEYEDLYDRLYPFAQTVSRFFELCARVGAQYREVKGFSVDHRFPKDFKMKTLEILLDELDKINQAGGGIYAKMIIRQQILEKLHEDDPQTIQRILSHYKWLPFDDKSDTEVAQILSARSPLDDMRILRENWLDIFQEIESENEVMNAGKKPEDKAPFYLMTYEAQKKIVDAKIQDFKTRITLANDTPVIQNPIIPDLNAQ